MRTAIKDTVQAPVDRVWPAWNDPRAMSKSARLIAFCLTIRKETVTKPHLVVRIKS